MHYITLFIGQTEIICCLAIVSRKETLLIDKQVIHMDQFDRELSIWLAKWRSLPLQKIHYRIILPSASVMQRVLQLPNLYLSHYEVDTYVKNSLARIFHTEEPLCYDYLHNNAQPCPSAMSSASLLTIYASQYHLIAEYQRYLNQPLKMHFIGIPECLLNQVNTSNDIDVMPIACSPSLVGINFLPWRGKLKKRKRYYFLLQVAGGLLLIFLLLIGLFYSSSQRLNQQKMQHQIMQNQYSLMTQQLSSLIELDKKNQQLILDLNEQQRPQKTLFMLVDYFHQIATVIPNHVWLDSLEYQAGVMKLKGRAFLHEDIINFVSRFSDDNDLQLSHVIDIKRQNFLLQFSLDFPIDIKE